MELTRAMTKAGSTARSRVLQERSGHWIVGRLVGIEPMVGALVNHNTPMRIPTMGAASVAGKYLEILLGQIRAIARVTAAIARAPLSN